MEKKQNLTKEESLAYADYTRTACMILMHTSDKSEATPISEVEFDKLEEKTRKALIEYAKSVGNNFKKYTSRPDDGMFYLVKNGYILLESKDFNLVLGATGENSVNGVLVGNNYYCGITR